MDTVAFYLPVSTWVHVRAFVNAGFAQRVTITFEDGTSKVLTGSGEHDTPLPNGDFSLTTPATSRSPLGWRVTVNVQSNHNGTWTPSSVMSGACSIQTYFSLQAVISEDYVDNDWNDTAVLFSWWTPPSARSEMDAPGAVVA